MATRKDNGQGSIFFNEKKGYWYAQIQWTDSADEKHKEGLDRFKDLLGLIGSIDCKSSDEESILIEVRINDLWKAVDSIE